MDTLKKEIAILRQCSDFKEIEKQLQTINKLIVTNYMFELSNGLRIYPIEVEAYFKDSKFNDESVHGNKLQKNNYGRFYVHRTVKAEDSKIKGGTRGGVDICLSDDVNTYYGILIRSAKFDDGTTKFVLVVDSKRQEKKQEKQEIKHEKLSFWDRILNLFK